MQFSENKIKKRIKKNNIKKEEEENMLNVYVLVFIIIIDDYIYTHVTDAYNNVFIIMFMYK